MLFEFIVLELMVLGPPIMMDNYHKGNIPPGPAVCEVQYVKAEGVNYSSIRVIDDGKGCTFDQVNTY